jgi:CheY-like chemotaxis protein
LNPSAKILFMSGYTEDRVLRENLLAPGAAFLEKPFSPEALITKTREILEGPETSGAAA